MKKRILPILLAIWPYLFFLFPLLPNPESTASAFALTYCALTAVVYLTNICFVFRSRALSIRELARWNLIIKVCHIPFFILVMLVGALLALAVVAPAVLMMAVMVIPVLVLVDVLLMLTSSCYGFRALRRAEAEGLIPRSFALRHTAAHCFFVADVISAFLVWKKLRILESATV